VDEDGVALPPTLSEEMYDSSKEEREAGAEEEDPDLLEARRHKDRRRYSAMTPEARAAYNQHRRELYHRQGEAARKRRRERERERYHSLEGESKKLRNERRAKLERDRYNKLQKDALAERNARRRERARARKLQGKAGGGGPVEGAGNAAGDAVVGVPHLPDMDDAVIAAAAVGDDIGSGGEPADSDVDVDVDVDVDIDIDVEAAIARAEQVIVGTDLDGAMEAVAAGDNAADSIVSVAHAVKEEDCPTIQI
jgi:hypothetical protein